MELKDITLYFAKGTFAKWRHEFYNDLAEALDDNGTLLGELSTYKARAEERKDAFSELIALWLHRMDDRSFPLALVGTVPDTDVMILHASSNSASLSKGLRFLSHAIIASGKMKKAIIASVAMPVILFVMMIGMLVGFTYLTSILESIIKHERWPLTGQILYFLSTTVVNAGPWLAAAAVIMTIAFFYSLPRWTGPARAWADKRLFPYSIYRDYTGSLFLVSLSALMASNMGISQAIEIIRERSNAWLTWHLDQISENLIMQPKNQARALDTGVFNRRLTERIISFGERSTFQVALGKVGLDSVDKATEYVSRTAKILNVVLLALCGAFMLLMIAGVMQTSNQAQAEIQQQAYRGR